EMLFGALLQLAEHERRDLRRRELAVADANAHDTASFTADAERQQRGFILHVVDAAPHESLDGVHRPRRRGQQPPLRFAADEDRAVIAERHDRRHERVTGAVANDSRLTVAHVRDQAVGRAEIDADDFAHVYGLRSTVYGLRWIFRLKSGD